MQFLRAVPCMNHVVTQTDVLQDSESDDTVEQDTSSIVHDVTPA